MKQTIDEVKEVCLQRLESCLYGTYDVVNLDVDPPTRHITTIEEIREHIQMHIELLKRDMEDNETNQK